MRVAINVEQLLYRSPGGVGRYTAQLAGLLPGAVPGVEVLPFCARHPAAEVVAAMGAAGIKAPATVLPLPRPLLYEAWHTVAVGGPQRLSRVLSGADVVHAPSLAVPPRERAPLVVTVHDAAPLLFPEAFPRRGLRFHRKGLGAVARRADLVLTVSHSAAEEILAHTRIDAARIRVVPNGVDPPVLDADTRASALRSALSRRNPALGGRNPALSGRNPALSGRNPALSGRNPDVAEGPFVLWVGSLEPRKNVATLVAAMAQLHREGRTRAPLVLAGYDGWLHSDLVPVADRAALGDDLVETGPVGEHELWSLYAAATVMALPSRHEGFGYPALEAMSQGTAVVASDIPALRELTAGAALLVAPDDIPAWCDAIEGLLDDPAARARAGAAGRARAARFDVAASLSGVAGVYAEVIGDTPAPSSRER